MAQKDLFTRLQRLFSTDIVIRNVGGNTIKTVDINSIQTTGEFKTNSLVDRYSRLYSQNVSSLYGTNINQQYRYLRTTLYSEYDAMDTDAIIASALDIIADESTLKNDLGEILSIRSSNENVQNVLYNLFYDVLNIEFNIWSWIRQMCKYGDFFLKLEISEQFGIYNVIPYTAFHITRHENFNPEKPADVKYIFHPEGAIGGDSIYMNSSLLNNVDNENTISFDNYEMAHFRLISDVNFLPYGRSYIEPARRLYKSYTLLEDAMLIHRITRAPEKRIFYINVGSIPPNEVEQFMQKTISKMKRTPYVDPKTGDYNLKYNMQNLMEDFYIPVRGNDTSTKIDTAKGLEYDGIKDVEYMRDKLFAALKVPKAFIGYEKDIEGKSTLASQDIRFARTIDRIQRIFLSELHKIALIHLYSQGYKGEELTNFELSMTTPSIIYDQERIELIKLKAEAAQQLIESEMFSTDWIYDNIYKFSSEGIDELREQISYDKKRTFRYSQIENEGNDPRITNRAYGTPHSLAALYGPGRMDSNQQNVPDGYDENVPLGRPEEEASNINKQEGNFSKDRLGNIGMVGKDNNESNSINPKFKGGPMSINEQNLYKYKSLLENMPFGGRPILLFEEENKKESNLLNENNINEQENI